MNYRNELGVRMAVYVQRGGYYQTQAVDDHSDAPTYFDYAAFSEKDAKRELRNALRRHARLVKKMV